MMQRMLMQVIEKKGNANELWVGSCTHMKHQKYWSEIRGFNQDNVQEFSGSGSAGVQAASGRISMNDFNVEKSVDEMSDKIFSYCCSGHPVDAVVIEVWDNVDNYNISYQQTGSATTQFPLTNPRLTIVLDGGINFSNYKVDGSRYFGHSKTDYSGVNFPSSGGLMSGESRLTKDDGYTVTTKETFKLWFTRMRLAFNAPESPPKPSGWTRPAGASTGRGWDAGKNKPHDTAITVNTDEERCRQYADPPATLELQ